MKLLGLSGSPTGGKTLLAIEAAVDHISETRPDVETEIINIRDHDVQFCDGRDPATYEGDTGWIINRIIEADALIVGTPMYRASYTGMLKNVFDLIPNDALEGKPVGLIATGGSDHHFLAIEHQLKPLIGFFQAHALPGAVYAKNEHYADGRLVDERIIEDLGKLSESVVEFYERNVGGPVGASAPSIKREKPSEPKGENK